MGVSLKKTNENNELGQESYVLDMQERTWLPRYCRGDNKAFVTLMQAYRRPVYSYLVHCGLDGSTCDDLFQEIFMKIHKAAQSYRAHLALRPWLFAIVANTVRNHYRHTAKELLTASLDDMVDPIYADDQVGKQVQQQDTLQHLQLALQNLSAIQRQVLLLVVNEGMKQKDVAAMLELPVNTVKTHLHRARLILAKRLAHWQVEGER